MEPQLLYFANRCIRCGKCAEECPNNAIDLNEHVITDSTVCTVCGHCVNFCASDARQIAGREMSVEEIMDEVCKDSAFYQSSAGGVTISGGEPFTQPDFLNALLNECRQHKIHSAVDTCGYAPWELLQKTAEIADLFLYDLKIMNDERHIQYTGVSNKIILDNLQRLAQMNIDIIIRIPIIPDITDDDANIASIINFMTKFDSTPPVDLLPFHNIAASKYERLGKLYNHNKSDYIDEEKLTNIKNSFESAGIMVSIGG